MFLKYDFAVKQDLLSSTSDQLKKDLVTLQWPPSPISQPKLLLDTIDNNKSGYSLSAVQKKTFSSFLQKYLKMFILSDSFCGVLWNFRIEIFEMFWDWNFRNVLRLKFAKIFEKNVEGLKFSNFYQALFGPTPITIFMFFWSTVEPECHDHPWDPKILAIVHRWSLFRGHLCYKLQNGISK